MTDNPTIGWIGTGRMGHAMATRLLKAGNSLQVWNRTAAKAADLADIGATIVADVASLASADIVFTMVSSSKDFADLTLGDKGLLRQPGGAPRIIVDSSTVSDTVSAQVRVEAEKVGTLLLAAPVSGNPKVVKAGKLSIVTSGPRAAFDEAKPYLEAIAATVTYVGEGDVARLVKLAHNILLGVVTQSLAEIIVLVEKGGVQRSDFMNFLNGSVMGSVFTKYKSPAIVKLDFTPTFTPVLLRKDFDLGLAAARELEVPMPVAALTHHIVQASVGRGHVDNDFAILLVEAAEAAGLTMAPEDVDIDDGLSG